MFVQVFFNFQKEKLKEQMNSEKGGSNTICIKGPKKGTGLEIETRAYYNLLHKQSLDNLERYAMLIIYNHYIRHTKVMSGGADHPSFTEWLREVSLTLHCLS